MSDKWIHPVGTQVVSLHEVLSNSGESILWRGVVGSVLRSPSTQTEPYIIRFTTGLEISLLHSQISTLAAWKDGVVHGSAGELDRSVLLGRVIYRCVIGSRSYGLETEASDTDRRGIYLPTAEMHWSLQGVPEQLENEDTQEAYWELQKFIVLALKANPNILECLYSPIVEQATDFARELLAQREIFLSKMAYQTFNGYVMSQFKKMQGDLRNHGSVKWKHVMHLIRLLLSGIHLLEHRFVQVRVIEHRDFLLAIRSGEVAWDEVERWRKELHLKFDAAFSKSLLPDEPDHRKANELLLRARRLALQEKLP